MNRSTCRPNLASSDRARIAASPTSPLPTDDTAWMETGPGDSFRPLRFEQDGFSELIRLESASSTDRR